jgi:hypothetical protein
MKPMGLYSDTNQIKQKNARAVVVVVGVQSSVLAQTKPNQKMHVQ